MDTKPPSNHTGAKRTKKGTEKRRSSASPPSSLEHHQYHQHPRGPSPHSYDTTSRGESQSPYHFGGYPSSYPRPEEGTYSYDHGHHVPPGFHHYPYGYYPPPSRHHDAIPPTAPPAPPPLSDNAEHRERHQRHSYPFNFPHNHSALQQYYVDPRDLPNPMKIEQSDLKTLSQNDERKSSPNLDYTHHYQPPARSTSSPHPYPAPPQHTVLSSVPPPPPTIPTPLPPPAHSSSSTSQYGPPQYDNSMGGTYMVMGVQRAPDSSNPRSSSQQPRSCGDQSPPAGQEQEVVVSQHEMIGGYPSSTVLIHHQDAIPRRFISQSRDIRRPSPSSAGTTSGGADQRRHEEVVGRPLPGPPPTSMPGSQRVLLPRRRSSSSSSSSSPPTYPMYHYENQRPPSEG